MLVLTAYTPAYVFSAFRLKQTCDTLGVPFKGVPLAGDWRLHGWPAWMRNCHQCFPVALQALRESTAHVLWTDADSTLERFPARLAGLHSEPVDFAVAVMPSGQVATGTFWARNSEAVAGFLEELSALCSARLADWLRSKPKPHHRPPLDVWEQQVLQDSLPWLAPKHGVRVGFLRPEECLIFDNNAQRETLQEPPVIVHWQASRGLKDTGDLQPPLPVVFPEADEVLLCLERPVRLYGNGRTYPFEPGPGSTVMFNNGPKHKHPYPRQTLWVVNCCADVPVPPQDRGPTLCPYTPGFTVHDVQGWGTRLERSTRRALAVPSEDWVGACRAWARGFGTRNPSTGLTLLHRLSVLGIPFKAVGFTGLPGPDHTDERAALESLGVRAF